MIPALITRSHIEEAIRCIHRDGVLSRRRSRDYCLDTNGGHLPPKYVIALAHQVATGEFLHSDQFSGGDETNDFLRHRGFDVVECSCRGSVNDGRIATVSGPPERWGSKSAPARHSERCAECKRRVRELLERIYGSCLPNHQFGWSTRLASYAGTSIEPALRNVATVLEAHRGYDLDEFVKSDALAGCDFWVPDPGFIVEFDESQHFTVPRKLAFSEYADEQPLGFSAERWIALCEQHEARDNDPPYRDEQRAWYDTLRDLVPPLKGLQPTVRLYAHDLAWCSLDPDSRDDRDRFLGLMHRIPPPSNRTEAVRSPSTVTAPTLRVAMVFPEVNQRSSNGVPPSGAGSQRSSVPAAADFAGESVGLVLFPEGYIRASDARSAEKLKKLASELSTPLLVGAVDTRADSTGRAWQVLLRFDPDGSQRLVYAKHSTADAIAFERQDWAPQDMLPTFEVGGVTAGATICHDQYLGLLPRYLAGRGARLWVNPSFDNVTDIKWSSILRLRAVENRFFALCTLHRDMKRRRKTHPFGFAPDGSELMARQAGLETMRPLSECSEAGKVYIVDLDMAAAGRPLDWSKIPPAEKPKRARKGPPRKPVRVALNDGQPAVLGCSGWEYICTGSRVETAHSPVYVGVVPGEQVLDSAACFRVLDHAREMKSAPIIWNHWERLPTDSQRLANLMLGRAIECCAPIVVSDGDGICELVELSNRTKIPARRAMEASEEAIVDMGNAWGLGGAFKMVVRHLRPEMRRSALDRYRTLA